MNYKNTTEIEFKISETSTVIDKIYQVDKRYHKSFLDLFNLVDKFIPEDLSIVEYDNAKIELSIMFPEFGSSEIHSITCKSSDYMFIITYSKNFKTFNFNKINKCGEIINRVTDINKNLIKKYIKNFFDNHVIFSQAV